ncbi:MAG: hypothetical protein WAN36_06950 [Calditrichia bacterium]
MAETETETLERILFIIEDYTPARIPVEIEHVFLLLEDLNQETNKDLWEKIRQALAANPAFEDPDVRKFIIRKDLAGRSRWWWDPKYWK